ncbi:MAG: BCCT family transporter [Pseudomonadales bacterium]|nr:BCCT family transporter [Pseudomonadales bacterium]
MSAANQPGKRFAVAKSGWWKGVHPGMTIASLTMVAAFVVLTLGFVEGAGNVYSTVRGWVESTFGGFYIVSIGVVFLACLYVMLSRHGRVRLGDDDARPEFSTFSWLAMLFSAGLGIGLLFFSISEPMFYFDNSGSSGYPNNPHADGLGASELNEDRAVHAMRITYFHWGISAWSVYVLVGLCLAYFGFRKKLPLTLRSSLHPIIGERIYGPIGHGVDLLAVFGTVFGVATSLGLGVKQMAVGLDVLADVPVGITTYIVLIAAISAVATLSAVSGVARGIRIISEWNIYLSIILLGFFLVFGPVEWLLSFLAKTVGSYLLHLVPTGIWVASEPGDAAWQGAWTIFYWGWWIAWAPFVGLFIARISRGRTIRQFTFGAMFVPTVIGIIWLCLFGGNALYLELNAEGGVGTAGIMELARNGQLEAALYGTIDLMTEIPWLVWAMSALATFLLSTWFITSSDSGTLVIATMLTMGDDHPPRRFRVIWGASIGVVAALLLLVDGLQALQAASIAAALPVCVILLAMTFGVLKSLTQDSSAVAGD